MFKLEFGTEHRGRVVNELSRALPDLRLVCPGGFHIDADSAEEILALVDSGISQLRLVSPASGEPSPIRRRLIPAVVPD